MTSLPTRKCYLSKISPPNNLLKQQFKILQIQDNYKICWCDDHIWFYGKIDYGINWECLLQVFWLGIDTLFWFLWPKKLSRPRLDIYTYVPKYIRTLPPYNHLYIQRFKDSLICPNIWSIMSAFLLVFMNVTKCPNVSTILYKS